MKLFGNTTLELKQLKDLDHCKQDQNNLNDQLQNQNGNTNNQTQLYIANQKDPITQQQIRDYIQTLKLIKKEIKKNIKELDKKLQTQLKKKSVKKFQYGKFHN
ncbi:hypothetical protein PPERSA_05307 [Pseudocohnilembus persalinus]|uniref:Uncharacterized protein n=1 Tax=Pseudocohnilembus persalinus TaxID=266149 RepID=A0A0V0R618_PSEPJ|nr:hypothetical protein PPERSA_05307 [Pseudocohnilembus persalinus]|eukprot:KRX09915.1 hypothetical protein PPERSA_05307 [Pseudocohnilembus persalinus]